ncbi:MAG: DegT/DnrJ/EryC1/StrS family aminotransferase [Bryobacteraceae bacterium]
MQPPILSNDFKRQWAEIADDVLAAVAEVGASGWYILGNQVREFEADLAAYWGVKHAVGVASGLDALELALRALGCRPGTKVLTSPISAFATPLAILKLGAIPVFGDCDSSGLLDLEATARLLQRRPDIRYAVPVHLYGHPLDLESLAALRDRFGLVIVEDCAQSIGATFAGRATATVGQAAATSFYPTKNLGAMGDGGAVLTDDAQVAMEIRRLRDYGQSAKYQHSAIGYNSRLDEVQAAVLRRACLPRLPQWTQRRRATARMYLDALTNPRLRPLTADCHAASCYHLFPLVVTEGSKRDLMEHLGRMGVMTGEHYPHALFDQPALAHTAYEAPVGCEEARCICRSEVSLPMHPHLTDEEVERVAEACNSWR